MKEGLKREKEIISEYVSLQKHKGKDVEVAPCGLIVSGTHGFLAASPDGIITDHSGTPSGGLIEVKLIFVDNNETLIDCAMRKHIVVFDKTSPLGMDINKRHKYYYQVQQQMFASKKQWTVFSSRVQLSCQTNLSSLTMTYWQSKSHLMLNFGHQC